MSSAVAAYRGLLRARARAFAGDERALRASMEEIGARFEESRDVDAKAATKKIAEAREAEAFIRAHVVQAVREGGEGNFAMTVEPTHQDVTIGDANEDEGGGCGSSEVAAERGRAATRTVYVFHRMVRVVRHCSVVVEKKYKRRVLYKIRGQMNSETSASSCVAVALAARERRRGTAR